MMRTVMAISVGLVMLVGCDSALFDSDIRKTARKSLKDPDSAKWVGEAVIHKGYSCLEVNAKNSYGGYAGAAPIFLRRSVVEKWELATEIKGSCNLGRLEALQHEAEVRMAFMIDKDTANVASLKEAEKHVLGRLKAKRLVTVQTASIAMIPDKVCAQYAQRLASIGSFIRSHADSSVQLKETFATTYAGGMARIDEGFCAPK